MLSRISPLPRGDRWQALARAALRYDLYAALEALTVAVLTSTPPGEPQRADHRLGGGERGGGQQGGVHPGRDRPAREGRPRVAVRRAAHAARCGPGHELRTAPATSRPPAPPTLGWCPHSARLSPRTAPWSRPTSSGCTCWSATGSCSPTCRSPTSCSGCASGTATVGGGRPRAAQHRPDRLLRRHRRAGSSSRSPRPMLDQAVRRCAAICRERDPTGRDDVPVREEAIPVVRGGRALAVVTRHTNLAGGRTPEPAGADLPACADDLARMIAAGDFPSPARRRARAAGAPRVGRRADPARRRGPGHATPARTRSRPCTGSGHVGDVVGALAGRGRHRPGLAQRRQRRRVAAAGASPAGRRGAPRSRRAGATSSLRAIPLTVGGVRTGALVLVRDVSELRRREQELLTKDATIREIHHRVKNNLQTVAALLRLQARRVTDDGRRGPRSRRPMRRVGDDRAGARDALARGSTRRSTSTSSPVRGLRAVAEVADGGEHRVRDRAVAGSFGRMRAEDATPLALVSPSSCRTPSSTGWPTRGRVEVRVDRRTLGDGELLTVEVADDGVGLPAGFAPGARRARHADRPDAGGERAGGRIGWTAPRADRGTVDGTRRSRARVAAAARPGCTGRRLTMPAAEPRIGVRGRCGGGRRSAGAAARVSRRGGPGRCGA